MIKLNLLDETEIPKEADSNLQKAMVIKVKSKKDKWFVIGPVVIAVLFLGYLAYYFLGIMGPLGRFEMENTELTAALSQIEPNVVKAEGLDKELLDLRDKAAQFRLFQETKQNWSRVLNILSDELPDEIVFTSLSVGPGDYQTRVMTEAGVTIQKLVVDRLTVNLRVPEESSGKVAAYTQKIESHASIAPLLAGVEPGGLMLQDRHYTTTVTFYFRREPVVKGGKA